MKLMEFLGVDKVGKFLRIIKEHGGVTGSVAKLFRMDQLKPGTLIGTDKFGNKYFENNEYYIPRNRWVDFSRRYWLDYDASHVPPEWHRWLHHMTDNPPTTHPPEEREWIMEHKENVSGNLKEMYVPYSTTRTKTEAWIPPNRAKAAQ